MFYNTGKKNFFWKNKALLFWKKCFKRQLGLVSLDILGNKIWATFKKTESYIPKLWCTFSHAAGLGFLEKKNPYRLGSFEETSFNVLPKSYRTFDSVCQKYCIIFKILFLIKLCYQEASFHAKSKKRPQTEKILKASSTNQKA